MGGGYYFRDGRLFPFCAWRWWQFNFWECKSIFREGTGDGILNSCDDGLECILDLLCNLSQRLVIAWLIRNIFINIIIFGIVDHLRWTGSLCPTIHHHPPISVCCLSLARFHHPQPFAHKISCPQCKRTLWYWKIIDGWVYINNLKFDGMIRSRQCDIVWIGLVVAKRGSSKPCIFDEIFTHMSAEPS